MTTKLTAIYDPATNAWTAAANKISNVGEESWSLIYDGSIHAVDCSNPPHAEKYIIAANTWVPAGVTPHVLVDSISEIGASVLLPDGRVFVIGATGYTAIYTPPPISNQPGTWVSGPTLPQVGGQPTGTVDAPAVLLPNGRVLFAAGPITSPASFTTPTYFFEYDPATNTIAQAPPPAASNREAYWGRMLMLPSGEALFTYGTNQVSVYTPGGAYDPVWRPTITSCPSTVRPGHTYTLAGRQINGLSHCVYYGNDATQATNYPIVRLEATTGSHVIYCRTFNFSTMGLQTGTVVHTCQFTVPPGTPIACYRLVVVANGIPSAPFSTCVSNKVWKELKWEIKEKNEIIEVIQTRKQVPEIVDQKLIREDFDLFGRNQEEWLENMRTVATQMDELQLQLSRTFIKPEERPALGVPPPEIEQIEPVRISASEARKGQIKRAYNDGTREQTVTKEADEFRLKVHSLSKGAATSKPQGTRKRPGPRGKR